MIDWAVEKKKVEDQANATRNYLDLVRGQIRDLEAEMYRLEGEYRLIERLRAEVYQPHAESGADHQGQGRSTPEPDVVA